MDLIQVGSVVVEGQLLHNARPSINLIVRFDETSKLPLVKARHGGKTLIKLPALSQPSKNAAGTPLIYHLATLANAGKVQFEGKVESISNGIATLRLDVLLPEWIVNGSHSLPKTPASAQLLLHMIPLSDSLPHETKDVDAEENVESLEYVDAEPAETRSLSCIDALKLTAGIPQDYSTIKPSPEVYSLRNCVLSIPTKKDFPTPPPFLKSRPRDKTTPSLADIAPDDVHSMISMLDSESLQAAACASRYLRHRAAEIGPNLKLTLFEHQRAAIRWMLQRELPAKPIPHPTIRRFFISSGTAIWGNTATGETQVHPPPQSYDFRGGLFCDEPGLGKTITILSLVLRTKGVVPDTPEGVEMTWFDSPEQQDGLSISESHHRRRGRPQKIGFYTISNEDADGITKLERTKSTTVRRSMRHQRGGSSENGAFAAGEEEEDVGLAQAIAASSRAADGSPKATTGKRKEEEDAIYLVEYDEDGKQIVTTVPPQIVEEEEEAGGGGGGATIAVAATKRQKVMNDAGGSNKDAVTGVNGVEEDEIMVDLTTPPPKEPGLAAHGDSGNETPPVNSSSDNGGEDVHGKRVEDAEHVNNQFGRQIRRHITFASEDEQGEDTTDEENLFASGSGGDKGEEIDVDVLSPDPSIACDLCSKWRRIPKEYHPQDENAPWCCYQHPLVAYRSCLVASETDDDNEHLVSSPGWVGFDEPEDEKLLQENVDFFRSLLDKYKHLNFYYYGRRTTPTEAVKVLITTDRRRISEVGFAFSSDEAEYFGRGYGQFLSEIGFINAPKNTPRSFGLPAQKKLLGGDIAKVEQAKQDWARWVTPIKLSWRMVLDQKALKIAIQQGPKPQGHRIYLSPATLIVVPTELIQHWLHQIQQHTTPGALRVAVYESKTNKLTTFKGKEPVLPQVLAFEFDIVITTFNKMSADWKPENPLGCSPLTQVHWLRIILDEGHIIGASLGNVTSKLQMATCLRAERRWVMTGTPAPSTPAAGTITLKYMQPLLSFLHDEAMGPSTAFSEAIDKQLKDCPVASRWRLQSVLKRCLIRASKKEILGEIKRSEPTLLEFTPSHAQSYNFLVDIIKANMLLCDFYDPDHTQSLLSGSQEAAKRANQALKNASQSCNVAGNILLQVQSKDLHACLELVAEKNGFPPPSPLEFGEPFCGGDHPLQKQEEGLLYGGICKKCDNYVRAPILTPCACLLCVDCTGTCRTHCTYCSTPYKMQSLHDPARKKDEKGELNPNPKWDVPFELIEWQPAFAQLGAVGEGEGNWQQDWQHTDSSKVTHLLQRLREIQALPPPNWDPNDWGSDTTYTWPPRLEDLNNNSTATTANTISVEGRVEGSRAGNIFKQKTIKRYQPKAIVFTQHPIHARLLINRVKEPYPDCCVKTFHRNMTHKEKAEALESFQHDRFCGVLIIDESGSHGLDLSFVQHVFIMEPIMNRSLEEQVVSRAWRLGVREAVNVEVLAMIGTYEEAILRKNGDLPLLEDTNTGVVVDVKVEQGEGTDGASGSGSSGGVANESKRQIEARRMDRNAYLRGLKPVRVR